MSSKIFFRSVVITAAVLFTAGCGLRGLAHNTCQADSVGCSKARKLSLKPCPESTQTTPLKSMLAAGAPVAGTKVVVTGRIWLTNTACTLLLCVPEWTCCNGCGGSLTLGGDQKPVYEKPGDHLRLWGSQHGVKLSCGGDESIICCPLPGDGSIEVVATGTIIKEGQSVYGDNFGLKVEHLCLPEN